MKKRIYKQNSFDRLMKAIAAYIKDKGGSVAVAGEPFICNDPLTSARFNYNFCVRITGHRPTKDAEDKGIKNL